MISLPLIITIFFVFVNPLLNRDFEVCPALLLVISNLRGGDADQARRNSLLDSYYTNLLICATSKSGFMIQAIVPNGTFLDNHQLKYYA